MLTVVRIDHICTACPRRHYDIGLHADPAAIYYRIASDTDRNRFSPISANASVPCAL